jgi:PAS domain S-box-containing protein
MAETKQPEGADMTLSPGRRRPFALRTHLLLLTLAVLLPALVAGGWTVWQLGLAYQRAVEASLQGGARTLAVAIDREIEVAITAVSSLAASRELRALAQGRAAGPDGEIDSELYERTRAVGDAFGGWVLLVRPDGQQLFNTLRPLGATLPPAGGGSWIEHAVTTGRPAVSNLFTGSVAQRSVLAAVAPVFPPGPRAGEARAPLALILAFDPARLAALLAQIPEGETAGLIQVEDGAVIARSVDHAAALGQPAPAWVATQLRGSAAVGFTAGASLEGQPIVAAFSRLDRVPWAVVVTAPESAFDAAWRHPLERLAIGGAALLGCGLVLAALLARRLLRPVQTLAREAEAVAAAAPLPEAMGPAPVAEFEALRLSLARAAEATRARAITEGRAAAAEEVAGELRAERDRARLYFDVAQAMLVVLGPDGSVRSINRHALAVLGLEQEEQAVGRDWFDAFLPRRLRAQMREVFDAIAAGRTEAPSVYENPVLRTDSEERLVAWRNTAVRDRAGGLVAVVASGEDITERRAAEEQQALLMREVDHRAKNALAVVQSIVRLTRAERPQEFVAAVEGRVQALARAHTLLARERWRGGDLGELIWEELAAFIAEERVRIAGPMVRLVAEAVQPFALVLHELATNAVKHGALSVPGGVVEVTWAAQPDGGLRLAWQETGGQGLLAGSPTRRGFGSQIIAKTVAGQLGGTVTLDWRPAGLSCQIGIGADQIVLREPVVAEPVADLAEGARASERLAGRRVLLVEDEPLVALDLEATLRDLGCEVAGPAATLADALRVVAAEAPQLDAAVLDVNLGGQPAFPAADELVRRGVPVIFATGYSELPGGWTSDGGQGRTALLLKPVHRAALAAALCRLILVSEGDRARPAERNAGRRPAK